MKTRVTVLVVSAMLLGGTILCQAMPGPGEPPQQRGCDEASSRGPLQARIARILELSEEQKGKIQAILDGEREQGQARQEKEAELRQKLRSAERGATFNEQAVRTAAAALTGLETERLVSRARTHHQIDAVLTASQRSLAERLRAEKDEMPPPPRGCEKEGGRRHGPDDEQERR